MYPNWHLRTHEKTEYLDERRIMEYIIPLTSEAAVTNYRNRL